MESTFQDCRSITTLNLGNNHLDVSNVVDMSSMFRNCRSLMDTQFFENFTNTDNVKDTIQKVLSENSKQVEQYKAGKTQLFGF